jgi:hypothetical protein
VKIRFFIIACFIFCISERLYAQVEHNYNLGPQVTNCDSLVELSSEYVGAIKSLSEATWRYRQTISLRRTTGFRKAEFFSCDGTKGYLVVLISREECIYHQVPLTLWDELAASSDPESFIALSLRDKFESLCGEKDSER